MRLRERIEFEGGLEGEIVARGEFGERTIRFHGDADLFAEFDSIGHVPLPPYIKRPDQPADRERYQTVFAREKGSVAAPTAGLHFTPEILEECRARGAETACLTLHVGLGTFQPLHAEQVETARLHAERYSITEENAAKLRAAARLVAVGTTSVQPLETVRREANGARAAKPISSSTPASSSAESARCSPIFTCRAPACCCWCAPSPARNWRWRRTGTRWNGATASIPTATAC